MDAMATELPVDLPVDTLVVLKGLEKASHLNGRRGVVVTALNSESKGRVGVLLFPRHEKLIVHAKPSNLLKEEIQQGKRLVCLEPCSYCKASHPWKDLQVCSICKTMPYCSRKCQQAHWKSQHKNVCQAFRELRKNPKSKHVQLSPGDRTDAVKGISLIHQAKGDLQGAAKVLQDAIEGAAPVLPAPLYDSLSGLYQAQGRVDDAANILRVALACPFLSKSDLAKLHKNLASALGVQGDYEGAIAEYKQAMKTDPTLELRKAIFNEMGNCYFWLGDSFKDLGDHERAAQSYENAANVSRQLLAATAVHSSSTANDLKMAHDKLAACLYTQSTYILTEASLVGFSGEADLALLCSGEDALQESIDLSYILTEASLVGFSEEAHLALLCSGEDALKESIDLWTKASELDPSDQLYKMNIAAARGELHQVLQAKASLLVNWH